MSRPRQPACLTAAGGRDAGGGANDDQPERTLLAGNTISTSVPCFGALVSRNFARFASARAFVRGSPRPAPPAGDVESCRNGSSAARPPSLALSLLGSTTVQIR